MTDVEQRGLHGRCGRARAAIGADPEMSSRLAVGARGGSNGIMDHTLPTPLPAGALFDTSRAGP